METSLVTGVKENNVNGIFIKENFFAEEYIPLGEKN